MSLIKAGIGILLVILGIVGLFLPLLQGVLMILAGLFILKNRDLTYKDIKSKLKDSFKKK